MYGCSYLSTLTFTQYILVIVGFGWLSLWLLVLELEPHQLPWAMLVAPFWVLFCWPWLQASSWPESFGYLLVASPLLVDACFCVLRRLLAGQRVFQAHRLHLFQRLQQAGWPHARVSLTYILGTVLLSVAMLVGGLPWVLSVSVVELLIGVWLDQRVAVSFLQASKS